MNAKNREAIAEELKRIWERDGQLLPSVIVEEAKDPESPLHNEFQWDTEKAAYAYWIEQARELIRNVTVQKDTKTHHMLVPAYIKNPDQGPNDPGYVPVVSVADDKARAKAALALEVDRARAAIQRCEDMAIALGLEKDIATILENLLLIKQKSKTA